MATVGSFAPDFARGSLQGVAPKKLIDVNVTLSRWPGRRLPFDEISTLVAKLRSEGVTQAWAGSFDGLLHKDLASVNVRLADECRRHGRGILLPFGSINPRLPDWEEELRRCDEDHRMHGIRLHPNYHGYRLDDPGFERLLDRATERRLLLQLVVAMEDERMQHPLLRAPRVDLGPLPELVQKRPGLRLVLLNWFGGVKTELLEKLAKAGQIYFDIAMVEGVGGVAKLLGQVPPSRVVFGSHAPFFYFDSALLKLKESALAETPLGGICAANAVRLLNG